MWTILLTFVFVKSSYGLAISTTTVGNYNSQVICQEVAGKIALPNVDPDYVRGWKTAQCIQIRDK